MDSKLVAHQIWATPIFFGMWGDFSTHAEELVGFLLDLRKEESRQIASEVAPGAKSSAGLFESDFHLFQRESPGLDALKRFIGNTLKEALFQLHEKKIPKGKMDVRCAEAWFHVTNGGGFHDCHTHPACSWCGIFYVQAGDAIDSSGEGAKNGVNRFYSPLGIGGIHQDLGTGYLSANTYDVEPRDGQLILFPSYLQHSALPYRGEKDRIVIAFNATVGEVTST